MKLGHIVLKVDDLDEAVKEYTEKGFVVEYGKKKNPYNALIYFAEGPYLELLQRTGMPSSAKKILAFFGKRALVQRLNTWDHSKPGLIGVALESDRFDVDIEQKILDEANLGYFKGRSGRTDAKGRKLKFAGIFPDDMEIPWFGAKFNIDVRPPKGFVHPNGITRIKSVSFGTKEVFVPVIRQLCDDEGLNLFIGEGVRDLVFEYANENQA
jgi:catechol 2,3-dioxygenase-like lactoylglutathione lyase family enzyme